MHLIGYLRAVLYFSYAISRIFYFGIKMPRLDFEIYFVAIIARKTAGKLDENSSTA